jgi:tripartite-type tricarboxylate transporter receptor subunit TctC
MLAITNPVRMASAPDVPTIADAVPGYSSQGWFGFLAPAGTPPAVLRKLHAAINGAVQSPVVRERFLRMGLEPVPSESPESVTAFMKSEVDRWGPVVRSVGLKLD